MSIDTVAVFQVPNAELREQLLRLLPDAQLTGPEVVAWRINQRYPFENPAQARDLAGQVVDSLGPLYDRVVGQHPGVWIEPLVDGPLPTALVPAPETGMFVSAEQAGTAEQRAADLHDGVEALLRVSAVLRSLGAQASPDQSLAAVLDAFSPSERAQLDGMARRDGLESFAQQVALMLRAARP